MPDNEWATGYIPTANEWGARTIIPAATAADLDDDPTVGQVEYQIDTGTLWVCTSSAPVTRVPINPASLVTAKGDVLAGTAAGTLAALGVGGNGLVLTADNTQATGLRWGSAGAGDSDQTVIGVQVFS